MSNRLLRYELALFRRSFGDAFSRTRDKILLAVAMAGIVLALQGALRELVALQLPPEAALAASAALVPAYGWQRLAAERLCWLTEESAVAVYALDQAYRRTYLAAAHILLLLVVLPALLILGYASGIVLAPAAGLAAYAAGAVLAGLGRGARPFFRRPAERPMQPSAARGRRAAFRAILRSQTLGSRTPGLAALATMAAVFLCTAAAARLGAELGPVAAFAAVSFPLLAALLLASRLDSELLSFLPFIGFGSGFAAAAVSALPTGCFLAAALGVIAGGLANSAGMLLGLLLLYALATLVAVARAWFYPGRSKRSVDIQLQIELVAAALLAMTLPLILMVAIPGRFVLLRRRYHSLLWKQL